MALEKSLGAVLAAGLMTGAPTVHAAEPERQSQECATEKIGALESRILNLASVARVKAAQVLSRDPTLHPAEKKRIEQALLDKTRSHDGHDPTPVNLSPEALFACVPDDPQLQREYLAYCIVQQQLDDNPGSIREVRSHDCDDQVAMNMLKVRLLENMIGLLDGELAAATVHAAMHLLIEEQTTHERALRMRDSRLRKMEERRRDTELDALDQQEANPIRVPDVSLDNM